MTATTLDDVLVRLADVTGRQPRPSGNAWSGLCPAHDDRSPSLSVSVGNDGNLLAHCHGGCEFLDILDALDLREVSVTDKPAPPMPWVEPSVLAAWLADCHNRLLTDPVAGRARSYLRDRGVTGDHVRAYRLGYVGPNNPDDRLDLLRGRVIVDQWPFHVEGRIVPGQEERAVLPDVKWLSARGATKRWWRADLVDVSQPIVVVEGPLDVIALDAVTGGNAVGTLGKGQANRKSIASLAARGVTEVFVGLDADATADQWRRMLGALREGGIHGRPVVGPDQGDWGDLLTLPQDNYWAAASAALTMACKEVSA